MLLGSVRAGHEERKRRKHYCFCLLLLLMRLAGGGALVCAVWHALETRQTTRTRQGSVPTPKASLWTTSWALQWWCGPVEGLGYDGTSAFEDAVAAW